MVTYLVNGKSINNIYLALHESWKTGSKVEFYCYDHEYDQYNWTVEPESSIDQLMSAHAYRLRSQYKRLILLWSGGTDSHTIYNIFRKNRIHLDEIIIKADKGSITYPEENVNWMHKNHWEKSTIITRYDEFDNNLRKMDLQNKDWIWNNKGDLLKYGMTPVGDAVRFLCEKNHAGHKWRAICGYEKPRLVYQNKRWYSRQLSMVLQPTMGYNYIEHFFLEPNIAIKQSHLVKQAVKKLLSITKQPLYNNDMAEAKWPKTPQGYREWSIACGRHDEVRMGSSHAQKKANEIILETAINTNGDWRKLSGPGDVRLQHDLDLGIESAVMFIQGLYSLNAESFFMNFLRDNNWFRKNNKSLTNLKHIWSKTYDISE